MSIVDALLAVARGDRAGAIDHASRAALAHGGALLPAALTKYLEAEASGDVYSSPDALTRFIDGGSNRALYDSLHDVLRTRHVAAGTASLLDLGCGDGRVTHAVSGPGVRVIDLVEPSAALLAEATERFAGGATLVRSHPSTAAAFLGELGEQQRWDAAQSTFALHTMDPAARAEVLAALAAHTGRLLVAEFDVPPFVDRSADHAVYAATRYERGLHEYLGDDVVVQGFLMPVLIGQFDPNAQRHTFEQPAATWETELRRSGFAPVTRTPLHHYWWADAVLFEAVR